jgi:hypothetical protein
MSEEKRESNNALRGDPICPSVTLMPATKSFVRFLTKFGTEFRAKKNKKIVEQVKVV